MSKKRTENGGLWNRWNDSVRKLFKSSPLIRFMLFLGALEERVANSFFYRTLKRCSGYINKKTGIKNKFFRPAGTAFSREMEQSVCLNFFDRVGQGLLYSSIRAYGTFLLSFVLYVVSINALRGYFSTGNWIDLKNFTAGGIGLLLSLILLATPKDLTLAKGILQSKILSFFLFDLLGLRKEPFEKENVRFSGVFAAFLCGTVFSFFTLLFSVYELIMAVFWILVVRLSYVSPESSALLTCALLPFISHQTMLTMLVCSALFFAIKLLRSKRNLKIGFYVCCMLAMALLVFFGGVVNAQGVGFQEAGRLLSLMLAFFLPALLFYRTEWLRRVSLALAVGAVPAAFWGVGVYLAGFLPAQYAQAFPVISAMTLKGFSSFESFGIYIAVLTPLFIMGTFKENKDSNVFMKSIPAVLLFLGAVVISKSPCAWIILLLSFLILEVLRKNISLFPLMAFLGAGAAVCYFVLPKKILSVVYAYSEGFSVNTAVLKEQFLQSARRLFAGVGVESAVEGENFYSHLLTEQGIVGVILLLFAVFGVLSYGTYAVYKNNHLSPRVLRLTVGASAGVLCLLTAGIFTDLFAEEKLLFLLFTLVGTVLACGKVLCEDCHTQLRVSELDRDYLFIPVVRTQKKNVEKNKKQPLKQQAEEAEKAESAEPAAVAEPAESLRNPASGGEESGK